MRKLINIKLISILSILAMFTPLFSFLFYAPVCAATTVTVIAASNSTIQWKSQATVVCDGTSDQVEINAYLNTGNTVELAPGTFNINGAIEPASYTHLYGQGDTTIINEVSSGIDCIHSSNIELDHFKIIGVSDGSGSLFIGAYGADRSNFYIHDIQCTTLGEQLDFILYANNYTLSNIVYSRCDAYNPDGFGFYIAGTNPSLVENVTYYKCTVENAGVAASRTNIWATGFDFAETTGLTINHLQAIDCSVSGAWESDFHFEDAPTKQDVIITGCSATRAGQKPSPTFGYGFVSTSGDVIFCNNSASNNSHGDLDLDGITHTPIVDGISPANSTKTATPVNQGNCSGVLVNIDSIHKELVLFSNDGNAVNQQIELGAVYTADDGNTYTFNGSKIITQFTNYAVIRLVNITQPPI
jgi:hypothetical protein